MIVCAAASKVPADDVMAQRTFYETWFTPYQVLNPDGTDTGLITGYYEPLLKGSRTRSEQFPYAIYAPPDDMLEVDMGELYPQFRGKIVRGRLLTRRGVAERVDDARDALRPDVDLCQDVGRKYSLLRHSRPGQT